MPSLRSSLFVIGLLLLLTGLLLHSPDRSAALVSPVAKPEPADLPPVATETDRSVPEAEFVARILAADATDPRATEIQQIAFAVLQKSLAAPTRESLLEKARRNPSAYEARQASGGGQAMHNPTHGFSATFDADGGVQVRSTDGADWSWRMEALDLPAAGSLATDGPQVERQRGSAITEWYVNEERGLEQFFTLNEPIAIDEAGESRIRIAMETGLKPEMEDHDRIAFLDEKGDPALYYHQIEVVDATGARLPARMELEETGDERVTVALVFDSAGATFPVTVDPFVSTVLHRFPGYDSSSPSGFTQFSGSIFVFAADDGRHGRELWKSDGTAAGTAMVKDILPGERNSSPGILAVVSGTVFFTADDDTHGNELWKSDLTEVGTVLVKDINPGLGDATRFINQVVVLGSKLYFKADDGSTGSELWSSDGTEVGTTRVKDINPSGNSTPAGFRKFGGELFFSAEGPNGVELWKTNGTEVGTVEVSDIHPSGSSFPSYLTVVNGVLYFSATSGFNGRGLWKSNGTLVEFVGGPFRGGPGSRQCHRSHHRRTAPNHCGSARRRRHLYRASLRSTGTTRRSRINATLHGRSLFAPGAQDMVRMRVR